jgi:hypothetical protein
MNWAIAAPIITAIIGASAVLVSKYLGNGKSEPNLKRKDDIERLTRVEVRIENIDADIKDIKHTVDEIQKILMTRG